MASAPTIGAIETEYAGVRFRSRTEARWAVFFDALGLKWEHEPEAYTDGRTWYTPDFWLPELDCFWEVKGTRDYDLTKVSMLCEVTGKDLVVSCDTPAETIEPHPAFSGLAVDLWSRAELDAEWREFIAANGIELDDNQIYVPDQDRTELITNRYVVQRSPTIAFADLMTDRDCVVKAAALATRFRFWEPATARPARVAPVCGFDRCPYPDPEVDATFLEAVKRYEAEWSAFCAQPWEDQLAAGPVLPVYPSDPRVVPGGYGERHDNLARKWFFELEPHQKKQIKKAFAYKGAILVTFYGWAMRNGTRIDRMGRAWPPDPPYWFERAMMWDTGEGDVFGLSADWT